MLKEKARDEDNTFRSSGQLVEEALVEERAVNRGILPAINPLQQAFNRARKARRPKNPTSLHFALDISHTPDDFLVKDISLDTARHLLFATSQQLSVLSRARQWYVDGTFKVVGQPFYQLFSVHAFIRSGRCAKQVPLAFALMSRRTTSDYVAVFDAIKSALVAEPAVECITTDFEAATWQAIRRTFPTVRIHGCGFHWSQAVERQIQHHGLQRAYKDQTGPTRSILRQLLNLPYLPCGTIEAVFDELEEAAGTIPDARILDVFDYVRNTWIHSNLWPTPTWCLHYLEVRTNNDVEGWHRRFHSRTGEKLPLYLLIGALHKESQLLGVQVQLIQDQKLNRRQRDYTSRRNRELMAAWAEYDEGMMEARALLKRVSKV